MTTQECVIKLIEELVGTLPDIYIHDSYCTFPASNDSVYKIIIKSEHSRSVGAIIWIHDNEICIRRHDELSCTKIEFCDPNLIKKIAYELTRN